MFRLPFKVFKGVKLWKNNCNKNETQFFFQYEIFCENNSQTSYKKLGDKFRS